MERAETGAIVESLWRFVAREVDPVTAGIEAEGRSPREPVAAMGVAGFPETAGGSDLGLETVIAISEELSRLEPERGYTMNLQAMTCPYTIINRGPLIAEDAPGTRPADRHGISPRRWRQAA